MKIDRIFEKLSRYNPELLVGRQDLPQIRQGRLYRSNMSLRQDVLYITGEADLAGLRQTETGLSILCICGASFQMEDKFQSADLIIIRDGTEPAALMKVINSLLAEEQKFNQISLAMTELLLQGKGTSQILDYASEILCRPLFLDYSDGTPVAWSMGVKSDIEMLKVKHDNIHNHFEQYREARSYEKVHKSKTPVYITGIDDWPFLISAIFVGNHLIGYLFVYECGISFSEYEFELFSLLRDIISVAMQKSQMMSSSKNYYEPLFSYLLDKSSDDPLLIAEKAKILNKGIKGSKYVLSIYVSQEELENTPIPFIRYRVLKIIRCSYSFIYKDHIVMIITSDDDGLLRPEELSELIAFLSRNGLSGGYSQMFGDFRDLWKYHNQSIKSIELGLRLNPGKSLYSYNDFVHFDFISIFSADADILEFCHPSLLRLIDYDRENHTDYVRVLYAYLKSKKNKNATADILKVYRTTVSSKLNKIKEIANIDLEDEALTFHLYLSYKMLEYKGELHPGFQIV